MLVNNQLNSSSNSTHDCSRNQAHWLFFHRPCKVKVKFNQKQNFFHRRLEFTNPDFFLFTKIGATIKIVTDDQYKEKCTKDILWVDYKNISKVLVPGARIFIDDGLISVIAKECGPDYVIGEIENSGNLGSKKGTFQRMPNLRLEVPPSQERCAMLKSQGLLSSFYVVNITIFQPFFLQHTQKSIKCHKFLE